MKQRREENAFSNSNDKLSNKTEQDILISGTPSLQKIASQIPGSY